LIMVPNPHKLCTLKKKNGKQKHKRLTRQQIRRERKS